MTPRAAWPPERTPFLPRSLWPQSGSSTSDLPARGLHLARMPRALSHGPEEPLQEPKKSATGSAEATDAFAGPRSRKVRLAHPQDQRRMQWGLLGGQAQGHPPRPRAQLADPALRWRLGLARSQLVKSQLVESISLLRPNEP